MNGFSTEPTPESEWYKLIKEAQQLSGYHFEDPIQNYLMLTLNHYTSLCDFSSNIIAIDYLEHVKLESQQDVHAIRDVGDQCLLLSGLFPQRVIQKNVSLHYVVGIGKQAYHSIATAQHREKYDNALFYRLYENFVGLMDLLHHMRNQRS